MGYNDLVCIHLLNVIAHFVPTNELTFLILIPGGLLLLAAMPAAIIAYQLHCNFHVGHHLADIIGLMYFVILQYFITD